MDEFRSNEHPELASIPVGTVTFLFTDIEGSTRLLERLKEGYATLLGEQRDILRACFARWNGHEIDTQGDSFFVAFPRALDAIHCVAEAQRNLSSHPWPEGVAVRVRMGLHTGEPIVGRTGYVGMDIHRAARIAASGYGGQVLLSQSTRELVYQDLPKDIALRDLGSHKLKDIRYPQQIFQLEIDGFPCDFPPLKTLATEEEPPTPGEAPFKGLQYFDEMDAPLFFGRSQITLKLVENIKENRFLAVIGASGSGKSSIVRAGLIPTLKNLQPGVWQVVVLTPTAHPLEALALALTQGSRSITETTILQDDLRVEPRTLHTFSRKLIPPSPIINRRLLLVVDQFEELFTLCRNERERKSFINNLLTAIDTPDSPVHMLLALRADFYEHLAEYKQLREAVAMHQEYLGAMTADELHQAIEEPAKLGGWEFSPGLVELMLHEVGAEGDHQPEPGALPLLSHALLETWKHRRGNLMNLKAYGESGGVRKAIAHSAESIYTKELTPIQQQIARNIFLRLTELGEGTQDTRRRASLQELYPPAPYGDPKEVEEVLVKLADARLITTSEGTVEVAHEALIREWPTLREWLMQDREGLRLQRHLSEASQDWQLMERDPSALYRGARLAQALEWSKANPHQLNKHEQAFLDASQALAEKEEAEKEASRQRELDAAKKLAETERDKAAAESQRAEVERFRAEEQELSAKTLRRRAVYLGLALVAAVTMFGAAVVFAKFSNDNANLAGANLSAAQAAGTIAVANQSTAEAASAQALIEANNRATAEAMAVQQADLAFARELAWASTSNLQVDQERSLLLAIEAFKKADIPETRASLHQAVQAMRLRDSLTAGEATFYGVGLSPDGSHLATGNEDGKIQIWSFDASGVKIDRTPLLTIANSIDFPADNPSGYTLAFSPDGTRLAAISEKQAVKIWDASTGSLIHTLAGNAGDVYAIAFSPDGRYLVTGSSLHTMIVWDAITGTELQRISDSLDCLTVIVFNREGTRMVSGSWDGTISLWKVLPVPENKTLVTRISSFNEQNGYASSIAFSPDGNQLALSSDGVNIQLYDITSVTRENPPRLLMNRAAHEQTIDGIYFYGETQLVTCSLDGNAKVWNAVTGQEMFTLAGNAGKVVSCALHPDGLLVTGAERGWLKAWDITDTGSREWFTTGDFAFRGKISPDGKQLITYGAGNNGAKIQQWTLTSSGISKQPEHVIELDFPVSAAAVSPDLSTVATIGIDLDARAVKAQLWELQSGRLMTSFDVFTQTDKMTNVCTDGIDCVFYVGFTGDGQSLVTGSDDGTATLWEIASGKAIRKFTSHQGPVRGADISPDGSLLATASFDGTARIWDLHTGEPMQELMGHSGPVIALAFSPDGSKVATASADKTGIVWDVKTGQVIQVLTGSKSPLFSSVFSPDGESIATGSFTSETLVWEASSGKILNTFRGMAAAFSPDNQRLVAFDMSGTARGYFLKMNNLVELAHSRITRSWYPEECQTYLHTETCPASE